MTLTDFPLHLTPSGDGFGAELRVSTVEDLLEATSDKAKHLFQYQEEWRAEASGVFEACARLGETGDAGAPTSAIHFPGTPWRASHPVSFHNVDGGSRPDAALATE